jgi:superfamily II DNA helicase RecQ
MLTATLPISMEEWFCRQILANEVVIIRAYTIKRNIRYRVKRVKLGKAAIEDGVVVEMLELEGLIRNFQKGVVYCRSIRECEALANKVKCGYYHSRLPIESRREMLQQWVDSKADSRWIVAPSGLEIGIDIKSIIAIIHMRQLYRLVDFVQQTDRGGRRNGEIVDSVIITDGLPVYYDEFGSDID